MEPEAEGAHLAKTLIAFATPVFAQSAAEGALPILYAATALAAKPGYYGPSGMGGLRGSAGPAPAPGYAQDEAAQDRLWKVSEDLSGLRWGDFHTSPLAGGRGPRREAAWEGEGEVCWSAP